jgi:PPOX class probable F420-dependent enzyme
MAVRGLLGGTGSQVPQGHRDLLDRPPVAALSTVGASGYPQTTPVWCEPSGPDVRISTMRGFAKERNMRRFPAVALLCFDPREPVRYLELRGDVVEMTEDGAGQHLDRMASRYVGRPVHYFGDVVPAELASVEHPVRCTIRPTHVVAMDAREPVRRA